MMENQITAPKDLLQVLGNIAPLSQAYQQRLEECLENKVYPAKTVLLQPGDICRRIYFVSYGLLRIFSLDEMGREKTILFMGPGELAVDTISFYNQTPATKYLETLQETTIQSITWHQLNTFYADFPEGNYIGRVITQKYLVIAIERNMELLTWSIAQRYEALLRQYENIEQQITQSQIASYLGVSRETLCKLKSEQLRRSTY
jgi:CRP-like cAMP-binding protein